MIKALLACLLLVALAAALQECNVANCKTCTDPPKRCDQCSSTKTDPRILLADGSACKSCPPNCVACTEGAEGSTVCDTCMSFFYKLTDNTCTHCPGHCEKCSSTGVCSACESKYKMVSKDTTCTPCPTNCATCADSLTCWTCAAGYYLDKNGNCQACPGGADCSSCKDNTECLVCKDKKWDSTKKTCVACQSNCEICDTKDGCTKCKQGYFLSNDKLSCHSCKNCEGTCSDRTGCSKCEGGYHKIPDGRCAVCQDQYGSQEICEACRSSVRGQKWGTTCIYCPEYCEVCTDENTCVTCKTGYTKVGTTCKDCSTLSTLEVGGLQETDCGACSNLYFSSTCQVCPTTATDIDANADACSKCGNRIQNAKFQCKILECSTSAAKDYDTTQCDICYKQGHKMYWTGDTCQTDYDCASLKSDATNKDKECMSCPNLWWNAATPKCEALICSSTEITNEIACQKCNKIFDSSGSPKCRDRPAGCSASTIQAECECLGWYWNGTQCTQQKDLSCENLTDLDSFSCEGCFRKFKEDTSVTTATQWLAVTPAANVCYRCHEGCDTCTATNGKVVCDTCLPGYSLIDSVCKKCPTGCYGCTADLKCASLNSKPACLDGFFESASTVCSACPPNCVGCTAADKCTKCAEGLIWDSNIGECVDCVFETSSECTSCLGSTSITGRYFDSSNLCKQCPVGCTKCSSDGTSCSECSSNYWLDTSLSPVRCTECPKDGGLASADTDKKCSVCGRTLNGGTGVFWNSAGNDGKGECTGCLANCQECTSTTSCRKCSGSRFFDTTSKTCKSCVSGCAECTNGDTCTKCITDKYFDTTSKTCISCDPKCNTTAAACDTVSGCTVCEKDHYLESQACKTCTDLDSNCLECSSKTQCTKCATRFYPKDDKCEACFKNCEVCDGKTCLTCAAGHCWDSSNKECFAKSGCKTCKSDDGVVTCMECESAHGLDICQPCSQANCLKCDADLAKCQNCAEGYYVTDSGSCSVCPGSTNCKSCSDNTKCSQCKDGFYWDSSSTPGNCVACGTNCLECSSGSTCTKCGRTGQYWDKTAKACKSCPTDCYECADGKSCNRCNNGTVWDVTDEVCTTCVKDCWNCKNATICKECLPGKYLTTGSTPSCESCGEGCLSCKAVNESVVCTTCSPGYLLNSNGGCDACDINSCTQCSDPSPHCSTCNSGFVLTSTKTCEVPCFKCSGAGCNKAQGVNDTVEPCPGLGSSHSCWITLTDTGGSVSYNRDCKASKCTSTAESCTKSGATTVCTKCCTTAKCNNGILQGHIKEVEEVDQGSAGSLKALGTLVVLMAVLLLL